LQSTKSKRILKATLRGADRWFMRESRGRLGNAVLAFWMLLSGRQDQWRCSRCAYIRK
jgi:hypothetical protein